MVYEDEKYTYCTRIKSWEHIRPNGEWIARWGYAIVRQRKDKKRGNWCKVKDLPIFHSEKKAYEALEAYLKRGDCGEYAMENADSCIKNRTSKGDNRTGNKRT